MMKIFKVIYTIKEVPIKNPSTYTEMGNSYYNSENPRIHVIKAVFRRDEASGGHSPAAPHLSAQESP